MNKEAYIESLETALKASATAFAAARLVFHTESKFGDFPEALAPLDEEFKKELTNIKKVLQ